MSTRPAAGPAMLRAARLEDLEAVIGLCSEHAAFEEAPFDAQRARRALGAFLFGDRPRASCIVAEVDAILVAYTTFSLEFSTWQAAEYIHMDCLFVKAGYRDQGLGLRLLGEVGRAALSLGCAVVEWQTPSWNERAMRFYERAGATGRAKIRYRWHLER